MRVRVPALLAGGAFVLGSLPVTEHVTRCSTPAPCPSVHTVVVLPERVGSGLVLALLTYAVVQALSSLARAASRPVLLGEAKARAISALALAALLVPASVAVGALVSYAWNLAPRTTGWAQLPVGLFSGIVVAAIMLGCAIAALVTALHASAQPDEPLPRLAR